MERFVKGEVVVLDFPFSDRSRVKRRPAVVLSEIEQSGAVVITNLDGEDIILCQVTSVNYKDGVFVKCCV